MRVTQTISIINHFNSFSILCTDVKILNVHNLVSLLQHLADILYKAAADSGDVDPYKVENILGVRNTNSAAEDDISGKNKTKYMRNCPKTRVIGRGTGLQQFLAEILSSR